MKNLLYLVILTTGFCSLGYQVTWQKYLSVLVGSEARSATIIISIFLLGLSLGYWYFGFFSKKIKERKKLLKYYGYIELLTGAYAILFPTFFNLIFDSSLASSSNLFVQLLITSLLLIPCTFLMGATIPIMTAVLPDKSDDIGLVHSKIYGINTLGAFVGIIFTAFYLVPDIGFELSIIILGFLNVLSSLIYITNKLQGEVEDKEDNLTISNNFNEKMILAGGLVSGLISLSLEIIWIRVLAFTIGNSYLVFPFILSIFILGIGLGSLTLKNINSETFAKCLRNSIVLTVLPFLLTPYLPLFISNFRVMLLSHDATFYLFYTVVYLVLIIMIFPGVFYLGRLLPFFYAFLNKNKSNYSYRCGQLYFLNTVGTFLGAVFFGYLLFYFFNLETIYKLLIFILFTTSFYFFKHLLKKNSILICSLSLLLALVLPYPRKYQIKGLFRDRTPTHYHFKNIFKQTLKSDKTQKSDVKIISFQDGANSTVGLVHYYNPTLNDYSMMVNGKSDSSVRGDFGTLSLAAVLPYLASEKKDLSVATVGIGTGVTSGLVSSLKRVKSQDIIEISSAIIDISKDLKEFNYDFHNLPGVKIHAQDAFQFFKSANRHYDIIISEPSNPWVMGNENLFTQYFYSLAQKSLAEDGLLLQWFHSYSNSPQAITSILHNIKQHFDFLNIFVTQLGDYVVLASNKPYKLNIDDLENDPVLKKVLKKLSLNNNDRINSLRLFNNEQIDLLIQVNQRYDHDIFTPKLSFNNLKYFFLGKATLLSEIMPIMIKNLADNSVDWELKKRINKMILNENCDEKGKSNQHEVTNQFCTLKAKLFKDDLETIQNNPKSLKALDSYTKLRKYTIIPKDLGFLKKYCVTNNSKLLNKILMALTDDLFFKEFKNCISISKVSNDNKNKLSFVYQAKINKFNQLIQSIRN